MTLSYGSATTSFFGFTWVFDVLCETTNFRVTTRFANNPESSPWPQGGMLPRIELGTSRYFHPLETKPYYQATTLVVTFFNFAIHMLELSYFSTYSFMVFYSFVQLFCYVLSNMICLSACLLATTSFRSVQNTTKTAQSADTTPNCAGQNFSNKV